MSYLGFDYFSNLIVTEIKKSTLVGDVVDYAATQFNNYPAVVVTSADLNGVFADTSRNTDQFIFTILCLMNRLNMESEAESTMRQLVDDIITRLNNNTTINTTGNTFGLPISVKWGYATAPDPDMRVASLTLSIKVGQ